MKKVLIVSHALELGGAERSLIGLLEAFDYNNYSVDLFLFRHEGELLSAIPSHVNLLPQVAAYTVLARPMKDTLKEGHVLLTGARALGKVCARIYNKMNHFVDSDVELEYSHKFTNPFMPKINPNTVYDLAISFLTPHYFVANKVKAKKKIAWIHTDYGLVDVNVASECRMWSKYDHIISISEAVTEGFLKKFPSLSNKIEYIENILSAQWIEVQSNEQITEKNYPSNGITLLSIGRFCTAKNFDNIPEITKILLDKKLDVYWYLIGFGPDEKLIKSKISEFSMENRVILLGKKANPYPYIKQCDVYVQPSRYEGKCVAVREAQLLGKPVIITQYPTSGSQLENGVDGLIVPLNNTECANSIYELLTDSEMMLKLTQICSEREYSNSKEIDKIYKLF